MLLIATSIGVGSKKLLTVEIHFNLVHTWVKDSNAGPEYLQIISPGGNITLKAESTEIRNKWAEDINSSISALCKDDNFAKCKRLFAVFGRTSSNAFDQPEKMALCLTTRPLTIGLSKSTPLCKYIARKDYGTAVNSVCSLTCELWDLPAEEYRAKVVENTEKALTDLLFQYGEQFQKKNYTPRKPVNVSFFSLYRGLIRSPDVALRWFINQYIIGQGAQGLVLPTVQRQIYTAKVEETRR